MGLFSKNKKVTEDDTTQVISVFEGNCQKVSKKLIDDLNNLKRTTMYFGQGSSNAGILVEIFYYTDPHSLNKKVIASYYNKDITTRLENFKNEIANGIIAYCEGKFSYNNGKISLNTTGQEYYNKRFYELAQIQSEKFLKNNDVIEWCNSKLSKCGTKFGICNISIFKDCSTSDERVDTLIGFDEEGYMQLSKFEIIGLAYAINQLLDNNYILSEGVQGASLRYSVFLEKKNASKDKQQIKQLKAW